MRTVWHRGHQFEHFFGGLQPAPTLGCQKWRGAVLQMPVLTLSAQCHRMVSTIQTTAIKHLSLHPRNHHLYTCIFSVDQVVPVRFRHAFWIKRALQNWHAKFLQLNPPQNCTNCLQTCEGRLIFCKKNPIIFLQAPVVFALCGLLQQIFPTRHSTDENCHIVSPPARSRMFQTSTHKTFNLFEYSLSPSSVALF